MLDASAFYAGAPFAAPGPWQTTPRIIDEVRHIRAAEGLVDTMVQSGRVRVREPGRDREARVREALGRTGDEISAADASVLALALETGSRILTDDYAVSNVAAELRIECVPLMTRGPRERRAWRRACPRCGRATPKSRCPDCDCPTRRKVIRPARPGRRAGAARPGRPPS